MWPPYYMQQRQMNPMGYPVAGIQFKNATTDKLDETAAAEKKERTKIIVGSVLIIIAVVVVRKLIKKQILS